MTMRTILLVAIALVLAGPAAYGQGVVTETDEFTGEVVRRLGPVPIHVERFGGSSAQMVARVSGSPGDFLYALAIATYSRDGVIEEAGRMYFLIDGRRWQPARVRTRSGREAGLVIQLSTAFIERSEFAMIAQADSVRLRVGESAVFALPESGLNGMAEIIRRTEPAE